MLLVYNGRATFKRTCLPNSQHTPTSLDIQTGPKKCILQKYEWILSESTRKSIQTILNIVDRTKPCALGWSPKLCGV